MTVELKAAAHRIFILQIPVASRHLHEALYVKTLFQSPARSPMFFATIMNGMEIAIFGEWDWMWAAWRNALVDEQAEKARGAAGSGLSCSTEVWRAFACGCGEVDDEDGLDQDSILRSVTAPFARSGISILYQSSNADDYLLVRDRDVGELRKIADAKGWLVDWDVMLDSDHQVYRVATAEAEKAIEDAMQAAVPGDTSAGEAGAAIIAPIPHLSDTLEPSSHLEVSVDSGLGLSLLASDGYADTFRPREPLPSRDKPRPDSGVLAPSLRMFSGGPFSSNISDTVSPISPSDMATVSTSFGVYQPFEGLRPPVLDLRPQLPTSHLLLPSTPSHSRKTAGISLTSKPIAMVGLRSESAQEWWLAVFGLLAWPTEAKRWRHLRGGQGFQEVLPGAVPPLPRHNFATSLAGLPSPPAPAPFISYVRSPDGGSIATEIELLRPMFLRDSDGFLQCTHGLLHAFDDDETAMAISASTSQVGLTDALLSESMPAHLPSATGPTFPQPSPERGRTRTRNRRDIKSWPEPVLPSSLSGLAHTNSASILDVPWLEADSGYLDSAGSPASPGDLPPRPPLGIATHSSQSLPALSVDRAMLGLADELDEAAQRAVRRNIKRCLQLDMRVVDAASDTGAYHLDKSGLVMSFSNKLHRGGLRMLYASTFHTANILVEARSVEKARRLLEAQ